MAKFDVRERLDVGKILVNSITVYTSFCDIITRFALLPNVILLLQIFGSHFVHFFAPIDLTSMGRDVYLSLDLSQRRNNENLAFVASAIDYLLENLDPSDSLLLANENDVPAKLDSEFEDDDIIERILHSACESFFPDVLKCFVSLC